MSESAGSSFRIVPVAFVRDPVEEERDPAAEDVKVIQVLPEYEEGLRGMEEASRLQILYWMHRLKDTDRQILLVHPQGNAAKPKRGVFALRSPMRPNPVGSTNVELKGVRGNRLFVTGLDALEGSPVIDIKITS